MSLYVPEFSLFLNLPYTIRRLIWELCLPRRIVEEDPLYEGRRSAQHCDAWKSLRRTQIRPRLAAVCREAREIAEAWGHLQKFNEQPDPDVEIWIQPKLDVIHLNWTRFRFIEMGCRDAESPLNVFLPEAIELRLPISILGTAVQSVNTQRHRHGWFSPNLPTPTIGTFVQSVHIEPEDFARIVWPSTSLPESLKCANQEVAALCNWMPPGAPIDVVFDCLSFHTTAEEANRSGLFGLLGDAPVQTVAFDDARRLKAFRDLFHALDLASSDGKAALQLQMMVDPRRRAHTELWLARVEWTLLAQMWHQDVMDGELDNQEAARVWAPVSNITAEAAERTLVPGNTIYAGDYAFNHGHWWVQRAREAMPRIYPKRMFRHCLHNCHMKMAKINTI